MHIKQTKQWGEYLQSLGWKSLYIPQAIRIKKLLFWSVIKIQRPSKSSEGFFEKVDELAGTEKALFVKIEPDINEDDNLLLRHGYLKSQDPLSLTKTIVIDLKPELDEMFKKFSKDTRQKIKYANGAEPNPALTQIAKLDDLKKLEGFYKLFSQVASRKKFWKPSFNEIKKKAEAFKNSGFLATSHLKTAPAATAMVLIEGKYAYYEHAACNYKIAEDFPYLLLWEIIKECKKRQLDTLDLCGIFDERFSKATSKWKKFSIFKKKWGGKEVSYPCPYIKYYSLLCKIFGF